MNEFDKLHMKMETKIIIHLTKIPHVSN